MGFQDIVVAEAGKIGFFGLVHGVDETGHNMFWVELADRLRLFGEYRERFEENNNDFDIEIVGFGYRRARSVGDECNDCREKLSQDEVAKVMYLVQLFFCGADGGQARERILTRLSPKSIFLGGLDFLPG